MIETDCYLLPVRAVGCTSVRIPEGKVSVLLASERRLGLGVKAKAPGADGAFLSSRDA